MKPAIETDALTRRFGEFTAVQNVNPSVASGQFFGFLGPNGAGKSTTIKMLSGLLAPTSGSIRIPGEDLTTNSAEVKRQIGVVPEGMSLFGPPYCEVLAVLLGSLFLQVPVSLLCKYYQQPWLAALILGPLAAGAIAAYALLLRNADRLILRHRDVLSEELCKI